MKAKWRYARKIGRLLRLYRSGNDGYNRNREKLLASLSIDEIAEQIRSCESTC